MGRYALIFSLIVATIFLSFFWVVQPIEAASAPESETVGNQGVPRKGDSKDTGGGQVAVKFSEAEIHAIAEALPDGEARQMFKQKVAKGEETDVLFSEETMRSGEEFAVLLYDGEKAFSRALRCGYR